MEGNARSVAMEGMHAEVTDDVLPMQTLRVQIPLGCVSQSEC